MKTKLGITIIILSFVVSLNPYTLIFVTPVFLIGCLILWLSKSSIKKKVILTIAPIILWYPGFLGFMYLNSYLGPKLAQKVEYRIPNGFKGQVMVIFPVECGQPVREENGREIIDIPEDGIVYYQGNIEAGYINWTYKLQDHDKPAGIYEFKTWNMSEEELKNINPDSLGVFGGGGWSTMSASSDDNSNENEISYKVRTLRIDNWKNREEHFAEDMKDSLQNIYEQKIRDCKKSIQHGI